MHHLISTVGLWFEWWTGIINIFWYNLWSGFVGDLTEWVTVGAGFGLLYRHFNCHTDGCKHLAFRHIVDPDSGEHLRLCRQHHPRKSITPEHIADVAHRIHLRSQPPPETP
jgi:hypothetical protein